VIADPLRDFLIHAKIEGKELDEALKIFNDNAVDVHALPELIQPILKETGIKIGSQLEIMKQ
jgi:hypothetical protein